MTETIERASHRLCAALHADEIDPSGIEVHLPMEAWWRLRCRLAQLDQVNTFDGRGDLGDTFRYMGVAYKVKR